MFVKGIFPRCFSSTLKPSPLYKLIALKLLLRTVTLTGFKILLKAKRNNCFPYPCLKNLGFIYSQVISCLQKATKPTVSLFCSATNIIESKSFSRTKRTTYT